MKYCWTTINVRDMEESINFYQEVIDLPLVRRYPAGPDMEIAFLGNGDTLIELICRQPTTDVKIGTDISIGFEVDSVDTMLEYLRERGIPIHSGPFQPNPNIQFFYILDPNGLKIQFVENL